MDYHSTKKCFFNFSNLNNGFDLEQTNFYIRRKNKINFLTFSPRAFQFSAWNYLEVIQNLTFLTPPFPHLLD